MYGRTDRQLLKDLSFKTPCIVVYSSHNHICWMWVMCGSSSVKTTTKWNSSDEAQHTNKKKTKPRKKAYTLPQSLILARVHFEQPSLGVQLQSVRVPAIQRTSHIYCGRQQEELQLQWLRQHWLDASIRRTNNQTDRQTDGLEDRHLVQQLCNSHKGFRKRNKNKRKRLC